ncbi:transcription elongation factor B polypeptide 3 [Drosophila hydei]|uniref:Transcription elongation factor B polypeptide 3 n=1 Tax=Drosophila hydei TaxID=7224 RepID=A0A6J2SU11_DROHY|nr:transcription elongation factor B polypeptide 3 [Drosophila hydei]
MTSTSNLADVVRHYQRSIERHGEDETRLLHCITKLFNLPITFEHLQETGIGKTVNALRKINGEVGVAAKTLVTKWKAMVAAEEEPAVNTHSNEEESHRSNGQRSSEEDQDQENKGSNSSSGEDSRHRHKSKHEERSKDSEHKSKSSSGSNSKSHSKSRSDSDKKHKTSSHDKSKPKDSSSDRHRKEQKVSSSNASEHRKPKESLTKASSNHHKSSSEGNTHSGSGHHNNSSSSSSSKHHRHQSSNKSEHSKSRHEKSKESKSQNSEQKVSKEKSEKHKSTKSSKRSRSPHGTQDDDSPKAKVSKTKPTADAAEPKDTANEFDSSMGANFDDVLGMLNMPMSGKKMSGKLKSPHKPATSTAIATSSTLTKRTTTATSTTTTSRNRMTSTKKPELLASTAKLEPLDPSIALELPTISNNYKPMPLNQTVMDVVFNQGLGGSAPRPPRNFNESEALAAGISSKTMRTKIYSGVRTGQILQVPSLFDLCTRVLQKNIDALEYTGGVPFDVLRAVLERATPHQLLNVEEYNPYLMEDSDVLWQKHVQRHCRSQRREEMETWREMFLRCEEEKERKLSTIAESIKASQKISEAPVRKTQLAFVDSMVKPPRSVQRKQEQYGTKGKLIATPAARVAALSSVTPNAAKVGDARLRVLGAARDSAQVAAAPMRNKKAPLMAKALQLIRGRHKR